MVRHHIITDEEERKIRQRASENINKYREIPEEKRITTLWPKWSIEQRMSYLCSGLKITDDLS